MIDRYWTRAVEGGKTDRIYIREDCYSLGRLRGRDGKDTHEAFIRPVA